MTSSYFKVKFAKRLDKMIAEEPRTTLAQELSKSDMRGASIVPCVQKTRASSHHWLSFKSRSKKV
jgi:hypothetical protein